MIAITCQCCGKVETNRSGPARFCLDCGNRPHAVKSRRQVRDATKYAAVEYASGRFGIVKLTRALDPAGVLVAITCETREQAREQVAAWKMGAV